jgi:two-component system, NarL family, sensor histidine kinase DegS
MAESTNSIPEPSDSESIIQMIDDEIRSSQNSINECTSSLEKMRQEVNKLTQRNTDISTRIQQTNQDLENTPRTEIKLAFENALDAQKRYLLIRGQIEKIEADQERGQHYQDLLFKIQNYLKSDAFTSSSSQSGGTDKNLNEIIRIEELERTRLSKLMHDGPAQALTNFILQTEIALRAYDVDATQAKEELTNLKSSSMKVFQRIRNFIYELKPFTLDDQGLILTIKKYFETFKEQGNIEISLKVNGTERPLGQILDTVVFRSIQELLANVMTFSQASLVTVLIEYNDRSIEVLVEDNGKGFDIGKLADGRPTGLNQLKERIEGMGGKFLVESNMDVGTKVKFHLPAVKDSNN